MRKNTPMAATLDQILLAPDVQPNVVADGQQLIAQEVAGKSGVSGAAIKLAYKTASAFAPGYLQSMVAKMLPDLVVTLEPYWAEFNASGASGFGDFLAKRGDEVAEAMLALSDERARTSRKAVIVRAYGTVRGSASRHIEAALPAVGALVEKYAA
jgi:Family of unknown function (DUF6918)